MARKLNSRGGWTLEAANDLRRMLFKDYASPKPMIQGSLWPDIIPEKPNKVKRKKKPRFFINQEYYGTITISNL